MASLSDTELTFLSVQAEALLQEEESLSKLTMRLREISHHLSTSISRLQSGQLQPASSGTSPVETDTPSAPRTTTEYGNFIYPSGSPTLQYSAGGGIHIPSSGAPKLRDISGSELGGSGGPGAQPGYAVPEPAPGLATEEHRAALTEQKQKDCNHHFTLEWGPYNGCWLCSECGQTVWLRKTTDTYQPAPPAAACEHPADSQHRWFLEGIRGWIRWCGICGASQAKSDPFWRLPQQQPAAESHPGLECAHTEPLLALLRRARGSVAAFAQKGDGYFKAERSATEFAELLADIDAALKPGG